jgi:hypothetical protein
MRSIGDGRSTPDARSGERCSRPRSSTGIVKSGAETDTESDTDATVDAGVGGVSDGFIATRLSVRLELLLPAVVVAAAATVGVGAGAGAAVIAETGCVREGTFEGPLSMDETIGAAGGYLVGEMMELSGDWYLGRTLPRIFSQASVLPCDSATN